MLQTVLISPRQWQIFKNSEEQIECKTYGLSLVFILFFRRTARLRGQKQQQQRSCCHVVVVIKTLRYDAAGGMEPILDWRSG